MATRLPPILSKLSFPACVARFPWTELNIGNTQGKVEKSRAGNESQSQSRAHVRVCFCVVFPARNVSSDMYAEGRVEITRRASPSVT